MLLASRLIFLNDRLSLLVWSVDQFGCRPAKQPVGLSSKAERDEDEDDGCKARDATDSAGSHASYLLTLPSPILILSLLEFVCRSLSLTHSLSQIVSQSVS